MRTLKVTMKHKEKLNNGKYLMTLSFGEVLVRGAAKHMVDSFIRHLCFIRADQANEYQLTTDGTTVNLMLEVESPTHQHLANHWARLAPNGKCQIMSFSSPAAVA